MTETRCVSFHRYTDVSIQSPPAAPPSEPRDQHQHIQLDDRVQLQLESAPLCEQQHSVSVSHSVKGGNSRRTPCVLRFPGHTTNCTNTEQHVEGPGAAFKEKRQRDVLYGRWKEPSPQLKHSCLSTDRKHSRKLSHRSAAHG